MTCRITMPRHREVVQSATRRDCLPWGQGTGLRNIKGVLANEAELMDNAVACGRVVAGYLLDGTHKCGYIVDLYRLLMSVGIFLETGICWTTLVGCRRGWRTVRYESRIVVVDVTRREATPIS